MGNEKKESIAEQLDDILDIKKEPLEKEEVASKEEEIKAENTILVTEEQVNITKEIAKIDLQIEALESKHIDTDKFYETIEEHLSEEELALEFTDKPAYMKAVNSKLKEYESANSNSADIEILKADKLEKESIYERQSAINSVITKHPTYNHEAVLNFFENNLTKAEQQQIYDDSKSYIDVYEKAFKKFTQSNPANIATQTPPNIPDVNNARKQQLKTNDVEESLMGDDEKIQEALGL